MSQSKTLPISIASGMIRGMLSATGLTKPTMDETFA